MFEALRQNLWPRSGTHQVTGHGGDGVGGGRGRGSGINIRGGMVMAFL